MRTVRCTIVGAGPYGLSAAAYLRAAGVRTHVLGEVMAFWERQMPRGMVLRSSWQASRIADPRRDLTLERYEAARGVRFAAPIPLDVFLGYGKWFQQRAVPDVDPRRVTRLERGTDGFQISLADGEILHSQRVVVSTGLYSFARRPAQFEGLPPSLASHSSDHADLARFAGQRVLIVGGGQSALESAALLREAGAQVTVVSRAPEIRFLTRIEWLQDGRRRDPLRQLLYPPTDVGPPLLNQIVAHPNLFRRLSPAAQDRVAHRSAGPAGAHWLQHRMEGVELLPGRTVTSALALGEWLQVTLDDGTRRDVDHALLATGYRVDVARYPFLSPELAQSIRQTEGYPLLGAGFESSVPGLHFIGAAASGSFGPLMRFVSGTWFTAASLSRTIARSA